MPIVIAVWLGWIGVMGLVAHKLDKNGWPKEAVTDVQHLYCPAEKGK